MNLSRRTKKSSQIAPLSSLSAEALVDINGGDELGQTALHYAMRANDIDTVKTLVAGGADVELGDRYKTTPLHLAALVASYDVILELLEKGPEINARGRNGITVLHYAVLRENDPEKILIMFLERGADISIRNDQGKTAMYYGIFRSHDTYACLLRAEIMQERQLRYDSEFPIDISYSRIQYGQKLCSLHPEDFSLRYQFGDMFRQEGRHTEACEWFDASIELDPSNRTTS